MGSICTWWLDDEHFSCCCIEPQSRINICEEIDGNSATREPTLIKICSKLEDANLSRGRISSLDSLHLCWTGEGLGRWFWSEVERKDPSGPSRMVQTVCHNLGWLKLSVLTRSELYSGIYYCSWMLFCLFSCRLVLSHCSRLEVFNKAMQSVREY